MIEDWEKPIERMVPHKIVCKCGTVITSGYQLFVGEIIIPTEVTTFMLCDDCREREGHG